MTEPQLDHNSRVAARRRKRLRAGKRLKRDLGLILLCMIGIAALLTFGLLSDYGMFTRDTEKEPGQTREPDGHSRGLASEPEARVLSPVEKKRAVKLAELAERPNELGKVPIIMYHVIGDNESEWVRTPENFRKDLQRFYELGYSLVPLQSYLSGNIDLPKGASPLVVTFDDATLGQFRLVGGECVSPDPDCAVGILLEFSKSYPDFGHAATFFVDFPCPFEVPDEADEKLNLLLEWGMEIGNHTYNHKNLWNVSGDLIQAELGKLSKEIEQITGSKPLSLALPYGGYPKDHRAREHLLAGVYE
ncbi:MAG TPA: polysaccharide deacetylase family protein, partial [Firmicutes bacterium]|nr:polysaccharide deacetylase family protein [Bacillota bacterium]